MYESGGLVGVSFQPGAGQSQEQYNRQRAIAGSGVQEAIKILSLRLPRVLGAQGTVAAAPLLRSQGSGGMVEGVVERAMRKVMGTGGPGFQQPAAPVLPSGGNQGTMPNFQPQPYPAPRREATSIDVGLPPRLPSLPRIIPGDEPSGPITDTPLPPAPSMPAPSDNFDPWAGYPNREI